MQVKPAEVFQLKDKSTECRMAYVLNNKYSVMQRAAADTTRVSSALAAVVGEVLVIGGRDPSTHTDLASVSSFHIASNTWRGFPGL